VQAQREQKILEVSTKATIDALVGEGFNAARTLRDHMKRWADMISAEYAGDTLRQAQLAKALAERLSATPDLGTEQQREDQVRKAIIGLLQTFFDMLKEDTNEAYQLLLPSASIIQPLTRSYLANKGKALGLQVKVGDVIVVELTHENEKYMLGVVTKAHYKHSGQNIPTTRSIVTRRPSCSESESEPPTESESDRPQLRLRLRAPDSQSGCTKLKGHSGHAIRGPP